MARSSSDDLADTVESGDTMRAAPGGPLPGSPDQLPEVPRETYTRIDEFARGGLGRIIRARDRRTGRIVAIKEMLGSDDEIGRRFVREALITANLQHPAIVPVYEIGRWPGGQPFYAMKLVEGRPLYTVIQECTDPEARLALVPHVIAIADALAYAHAERLIHRDIKPHNVLVGAFGETVVIDWGLARRFDERDASLPRQASGEGELTVLGAVLGTPAYMAPEQARGERVDARADVYATGAVLYHVLCGRPPYVAEKTDRLLELVRARAPHAVREIARGIPPDLAAIVERAMARDRDQRYRSAAELAIDLRRFANGQLVLAHRYTPIERARRFARRQRVPLAIATLATAAVVTVGTIALRDVLASRAQARLEQREASTARDDAQRRLRSSYLEQARAELERSSGDRALPLIAAAARLGGLDPATRFLAARALEQLPAVVHHPGNVATAAIVGDHDVVLASQQGVERWSPVTDRVAWQLPGAAAGLANAGGELEVARAGGIALLDPATGRITGQLADPRGGGYRLLAAGQAVDAGPQRWLAALADDRIDLWDLKARTLRASIAAPGAFGIGGIAPDGSEVVFVAARHDGVGVTDLAPANGEPATTLCSPCGAVAVLGDDIAVVSRAQDQRVTESVRFVDWAAHQHDLIELGAPTPLQLSLRPDLMAVAMLDGGIELFDRHTRALRWKAQLPELAEDVWIDGSRRLWVLCSFAGLFAFDLSTGFQLAHFPGESSNLSVSRDGSLVVMWGDHGATAMSLSRLARAAIAPTPARVTWYAFARDGTLVTASKDGTIARFDPDGRELGRISASTSWISGLQVLEDGSIVAATHDGEVLVLDGSLNVRVRFRGGDRAEASPDGRWIAGGATQGDVALWDASGAHLRTLGKLTRAVIGVRWTGDGRTVAAIDDDGQIAAWDAATGRELRALPALGDGLGLDVAVSPDGRWLARCATQPEPFRLYALAPGVADRALAGVPDADVYAVRFTADGQLVALAGKGFVGVWSVATGARRMLAYTGTLSASAAFGPGASLLYAVGLDRRLRVWNVATGSTVMEIAIPDQAYGFALSHDGTRAIVGTLGGALLLDTSSFPGDLASLSRAATTRTRWHLDDTGRLAERVDDAAKQGSK